MNTSRLANLFYRNPRLTVLAIAFIVVAGLAALQTLARQEDPTMTRRFAQVETEFPGATAARVESLVTEKLETRLREIGEIRELRSLSRGGRSIIIVQLHDRVGPDRADVIWGEVRDKLVEARSDLPQGAARPKLEVQEPIASTLVLALTWRGSDAPQLPLLGRLARDLELRLGNLAGTRETAIHGDVGEEIRVAVDPHALAGSGLTAAQVADRIAAADTRLPSGRLQGDASDLLVEVMGALDSSERIARIPLARRETGELLRVGDVATVRKATRDPPATMAFSSGARAVIVSVTMEPAQRIDHWVDDARAVVDRFGAQLPPQISLEVIFDQSVFTGTRLGELTVNLVTALAIIVILLVVFMGVRAALTVGLALPLSMGMVLAGLMFMDIPLHQMSVTGLIIALGLLIDNAIVVVEEFKLRRRRGRTIPDAIAEATTRLVVPLAASTATTVLAFLPVAFTPGPTGEFTGTIAISVVLSVISSFLLAMTVIPAIAGFLDRRFPPGKPRERPAWWTGGIGHAGLRRAYGASLDAVLRRPLLGIVIGLALPMAGFVLAGTLTLQFFPPVDRNQFQVQMTLPAGTAITETRREVERLRALLHDYDEVVDDAFFLGASPPRVYYNVIGNNDGVTSFAGGFVTTRSARATRALLPRLQQHLMDAFPNARILALPFEQGPPFEAPIEVRIVGDELAVLRESGERIRALLADTGGVTYTSAALDRVEPSLAVHPDENLTAQAGLVLSDLPRQIDAGLSGHRAGMVMEGVQELPVRVRHADATRMRPSHLAGLPVLSAATDGAGHAGIPLEHLARITLEPTASIIERFQGQRINTVQGFLMPFELPASALARFQQRLEASELEMPAGYRLEIGGEAEERNASVGSLLRSFVLFLVLIIAVVVLSLNSFRHAAIIGVVGLLSVGLALFGVRVFGWPLGFTAMIGTLGLIGLAINGAIIVLSALKADPGAAAGDRDRCREVVMDSTRHIVSTTVTTIGGFLPLILFGGTFWPPLATAIAGGVAGSAILALYLVPAIFVATLRPQRLREIDGEKDTGPLRARPTAIAGPRFTRP